MNPLIITVHGMGGSTYYHNQYLIPALHGAGFDNVHTFWFDTRYGINNCAKFLENMIEYRLMIHDVPDVILIGHSAGGRIAFEADNPRIKGILSICSPLKGSWLAHKLRFLKFWYKDMITDISTPLSEERMNVPHVSIISSYMGSFDGRMWKEEMVTGKEIEVIEAPRMYHGSQLSNPEMIATIVKATKVLLDHIK